MMHPGGHNPRQPLLPRHGGGKNDTLISPVLISGTEKKTLTVFKRNTVAEHKLPSSLPDAPGSSGREDKSITHGSGGRLRFWWGRDNRQQCHSGINTSRIQ